MYIPRPFICLQAVIHPSSNLPGPVSINYVDRSKHAKHYSTPPTTQFNFVCQHGVLIFKEIPLLFLYFSIFRIAFRQSLGLSPRCVTSTASVEQHSWRDILHCFTNERFLKLFCKCAATVRNGVLVFDCACDVSNVGIIRCGCPGVFQHSPYISADACFFLPTLKSADSWKN